MFRQLIIFSILLCLKPALGSSNETIIASHIYDDEQLNKMQHQIELLTSANENLRLRMEVNNERMDRHLTEISNEIKTLNGLPKEIINRLSGLANEIHSLGGLANETDSRLSGLANEIHSLGGLASGTSSHLNGLANETNIRLNGLANKIHSLGGIARETNSRLNGLANEIHSLGGLASETNSHLNGLANETNSRLNGLANEIHSLGGLANETDSRLSGLANEIHSLGGLASETNSHLNGLANETNSRLNGLANEIHSLGGLANETDSRLSGLANEIHSLGGLASETNKRLNGLANETNSRLSRIANEITEIKNSSHPSENSSNSGNENSKKGPYPTSCLRLAGGLQQIQIDRFSPDPFHVCCDNGPHGGGWTVIQRRKDGSVDFYRNWDDYKRGFGNLMQEFFIGLQKLHALTTTSTNELLIVMRDKAGIEKFAKYDAFAIGDESEHYALNILGKYSGDAGDELRHVRSGRFCTKDNDGPNECAVEYTRAWWEKDDACFSSLNGKYGDDTYAKGINWYSFHRFEYSLPYVQMMIRPKSQ